MNEGPDQFAARARHQLDTTLVESRSQQAIERDFRNSLRRSRERRLTEEVSVADWIMRLAVLVVVISIISSIGYAIIWVLMHPVQ